MDRGTYTQRHHFFTTTPLPCPYIEGRVERRLVTELVGPESSLLHDILTLSGFRRSHSIVYAPVCQNCQACIPVRIPTKRFKPGKTQRRLWKHNSDLTVHERPAQATKEQFDLFHTYLLRRHGEGDMAMMEEEDYETMVSDSPVDTAIFEFRDPQGTLLAACLTDSVRGGYSAVYSFYAPDIGKRSLGTYMIMWLVEHAKSQNLDYVYLGFWIRDSRKMAYKALFHPLESYYNGKWCDLNIF